MKLHYKKTLLRVSLFSDFLRVIYFLEFLLTQWYDVSAVDLAEDIGNICI